MSLVSLIIGYIAGVVSTLLFTLVLNNNQTAGEADDGTPFINPTLAVFIGATIIAGFIYWQVGSPDIESVNRPEASTSSTGMVQQSDEHMMGDLDAMAQRLADKLEKNPDNGEGWALLARSYVELKQHQKAVAAFENAENFIQDDPQLLADYADALAVTNNGQFDAQTTELVEKALKVDPNHPKALLLAGTISFNHADYAKAINIWEHLLPLIDKEDVVLLHTVNSSIVEAKALLGTQ